MYFSSPIETPIPHTLVPLTTSEKSCVFLEEESQTVFKFFARSETPFEYPNLNLLNFISAYSGDVLLEVVAATLSVLKYMYNVY